MAAVEATRSYRKWKTLKDGELLTYNQVYVKGQPKHDWLLKKNIWRRMRYRRENKKIVEKLKLEDHEYAEDDDAPGRASGDTSSTTARTRSTRAVVATAAAVAAAAAASMMDNDTAMDDSNDVVHNPLDAVADSAALDAAARLADAATVDEAAVAAATAAVSQGSVEV